jgi:flagellar motor switch protein FliN/FliY
MQLLPVSFAKDMVSILMGGGEDSQEASAPAPTPAPAAQQPQQPIAPPMGQPDPYAQPMYQQPPMQQQPMYEQPMYPPQQPMYQQPMYPPQQPMYQQPPAAYGNGLGRDVNVQPAQFSNFAPHQLTPPEDTNLNLLLDIPLKVTVELGRTQKVIKDILELSQGSIIELDKLAGEPVDILVNNKLIAKGEVVVIDENFGVRVTDIVNQWDRIQKLQY